MATPYQPGDQWKISETAWKSLLHNKGVTIAHLREVAKTIKCTHVQKLQTYDELVSRLIEFGNEHKISKVNQKKATRYLCLRSELMRKEGGIPHFRLIPDEEDSELQSFLDAQEQEVR